MTIEELIQKLAELRDRHGPHIVVGKSGRPIQGITHYNNIRKVRLVKKGRAVWDDFLTGTRNVEDIILL